MRPVLPAATPAALPALERVTLPPEPWSQWVWTTVGTALDQAVIEAMRRVIDVALMPAPGELPALRAAAGPYVSGPLWDRPRGYFPFIGESVPLTAETRYRRRLRGGLIIGRRFTVPYRPHHGPGGRRPPRRPHSGRALDA
jgi:hypothetical protein